MLRFFLPILLTALLLLSAAGNVLLLQQGGAFRAEAARLRTRALSAEERQSALQARVAALEAQLNGVQAAGAGAAAAATVPAPEAAEAAAVRRIESQVSAIRGLRKQRDVPLRFKDRADLRAYFVESFERDYLPHERETDQKLLVTLGLLAPHENLVEILTDLLEEQVIGIYDEEEKAMYLIQDRAEFGPEERLTVAHELVHAVQDEAYDLGQLAPKHPDNADRSLAVHAVIEGDAVLVQRLWLQEHLTPDDIAKIGQGGDSSRLDTAPLVVRRELLFPYGAGFRFVLEAYQRAEGFHGVDELFRRPPRSTEQVLHPEKYRQDELPVEVVLPDLASAVDDGWRKVGTNVFGELDLQILLEQYAERNAAGRAAAERGAAGWGGDRWQLLEKDGRQAVVLKTAWDTENDAREFFDIYGRGLRSRFQGATEASEPTRLALTTGSYAVELRRAGRDVLAVISFDRSSAEQLVATVGGF